VPTTGAAYQPKALLAEPERPDAPAARWRAGGIRCCA